METAEEIRARYKEAHDLLTERYYKRGELSKAEFDHQHGMIWADMESELIVMGHKLPPTPLRDLEAEIDVLIGRIKDLETRG